MNLLYLWIFLIGLISIFNTLQNFLTLKFTQKIYNQEPKLVNSLQSRTFAIWTLTSGLIRIYTAYNIHHQALYQLTIGSYLIALFHFGTEFMVFKTCQFSSGLISPLIVASTSLIWMIRQYDFYVR
ncbi:hypothetical protein DFH28DRAFT_1081280 [Melampsora americana]|nr:hypothetical protein DFH28DRAFT_1081280 [Melampsora americana]